MLASTKCEKIFQREKTLTKETKRVLIALNWIFENFQNKTPADSYLSFNVKIKFVLSAIRNALVLSLRISGQAVILQVQFQICASLYCSTELLAKKQLAKRQYLSNVFENACDIRLALKWVFIKEKSLNHFLIWKVAYFKLKSFNG